ncbi:hypothetical protein BJY52DRAFT_1228412 [Lactarius psammicola]|nr:hypothetical protein BJY52DRAFT_1228412 [Lactarius psammicola]
MPQIPPSTASSASFEETFRVSLEAYRNKTKKDIASHPLAAQLKSCDSPSAILDLLQAQAKAFDKSQSADENLTKWLDPTVNVLCKFSAVLGDAVAMIFPPASAIFTGIGVLLQAIKDVRDSQDSIVTLFGRIGNFFKRLEEYIEVQPTAAMMDVIVKIMVEVLSILGIVTKEIGQGRMKKYLKEIVGRRDVEDALDGIDVKVQGVGDKVQGVNDKAERRQKRRFKQVANEGVEYAETSKTGSLPPIRLSIMSPRAMRTTRIPQPGARKATPSPIGKRPGSLLWIHGKPGSGKSILSSVIIRDIKDGSGSMAYFYFDFGDTRKQDSRALLSSLLVQLSNQSDQFCDVLRGLYIEHQGGLQQPNNASLLRCLKSMLTIAGPRPVYLVMDALDECPKNSGVPSPREKVLELSSTYAQCLESLKSHQLSLDDESGQKQDIIDYVTSVVRSDRWKKRWQDKEKDLIIEKLAEKASGM